MSKKLWKVCCAWVSAELFVAGFAPAFAFPSCPTKIEGLPIVAPAAASSGPATTKQAGAPSKPATAPAQSSYFKSGVSLYGAKRYEEASKYFTATIKAEPSNSDAYYYLANCQHMIGDQTAARRLYEYIVKYFPATPAATSAQQFIDGDKGAQPAKVDNAQPLKDAWQSAVKRATNAPSSIASLVQVVRARADRPEVSKEAVSAIKTAADGLPLAVKDVLWSHNVRIYVTPTVEDYSPGVKYEQARGYEGGTYKSCPAFYSNGKIVIAERTMDEGDESLKDAFAPSQMVNSLYHETGHALDFCLDDISHSDEFRHSYLLDSANIDPATANTLRYYLQKSEDGQEECCAELLGTILGQSESHTAALKSSFPLTIKFLRAKLRL